MSEDIYFIYHKNCKDGFGAAYAAWKKFGDRAIYIPMSYYDKLPDIKSGSTVYMGDFSLPKNKVLELIEKCKKVVILDHHISAKNELQDIPGLNFIDLSTNPSGNLFFISTHTKSSFYYSLKRSGAVLCWEYFHPNKPLPLLLAHIQDYDLWNFHLNYTKEINYALDLYPKSFTVWDSFDTAALIGEGSVLSKFALQESKRAEYSFFLSVIGGHLVPCFRVTSFPNEVADHLLSVYKQFPFVCYFYPLSDGRLKCSLRARSSNSVDVSKVAKLYGGGGHTTASGFVCSYNDIFKKSRILPPSPSAVGSKIIKLVGTRDVKNCTNRVEIHYFSYKYSSEQGGNYFYNNQGFLSALKLEALRTLHMLKPITEQFLETSYEVFTTQEFLSQDLDHLLKVMHCHARLAGIIDYEKSYVLDTKLGTIQTFNFVLGKGKSLSINYSLSSFSPGVS